MTKTKRPKDKECEICGNFVRTLFPVAAMPCDCGWDGSQTFEPDDDLCPWCFDNIATKEICNACLNGGGD